MRVLVYAGLNYGKSFEKLVDNYDMCFGFEANPVAYLECAERFCAHPKVKVVHAALTTGFGEVDFHVYKFRGASSLGKFRPRDMTPHCGGANLAVERTVRVPGIHLGDFLRGGGVTHITDYVSDLQGMDLAVLETLRPMLRSGSVESVQCEVAKGRNSYLDLPSNAESDYAEVLGPRYILKARSFASGLLGGNIRPLEDFTWGYDCRWVLT